MQLLLRRNYLVLSCDHHSREWVAVEGEPEHIRFEGFTRNPAGKPCWLLCNAYRRHEIDNWTYTRKGRIAGTIEDNAVKAIWPIVEYVSG